MRADGQRRLARVKDAQAANGHLILAHGGRTVDASMGFTVGKEDNYEKAKH
jgi:hypothetical protein